MKTTLDVSKSMPVRFSSFGSICLFAVLMGVLFPTAILAQTSGTNSTLDYENVLNATVYVERSLFLDPKDCDNPQLISKFETATKRKLLGYTVAIGSGSGFFVDGDGHILSNRHVIDVKDSDKERLGLYNFFLTLVYKQPDSVLSQADKIALKQTLKAMIDAGSPRLTVTLRNKRVYPAKVINIGTNADLALLDIGTVQGLTALPLDFGQTAKVGDSVTSVGFPLGAFVADLFKDSQASLTKGYLSAIRNEEWGLQHTAPINPGNSGGPLINSDGLVIGVNVGVVQNANSLFFAIPVSFVESFLHTQGRDFIITTNKKLNHLGEQNDGVYVIESAKSILITSDRPAQVVEKGLVLGMTPINYQVTGQLASLDIHDDTGTATVTLVASERSQAVSELKVNLVPFKGKLMVLSEKPGVEIRAGGIYLGRTPLSIDLAEGKYSIEASSSEEEFDPSDVTVERGKTERLNLSGRPVYPVVFAEPLIDGTSIIVKSSGKTLTFQRTEDVRLTQGTWTIKLLNPDYYKDTETTLRIDAESATFDPAPFRESGQVRISGLPRGSTVLLDGQTLADVKNETPFQVSSGQHNVLIRNKDYEDFPWTVDVKSGNSLIIPAKPVLTKPARRAHILGDDLIFLAITGAVFGGSVILNQVVAPIYDRMDSGNSTTLRFFSGVTGVISAGSFGVGLFVTFINLVSL